MAAPPKKPKRKPISTVAELEAAGPGWHTVTGGRKLLFHVKVSKRGHTSRAFAVRLRDQKRSKRGLGPYPLVTLAEAREKSIDFDREFAKGNDPGPRAERRRRLADAARSLTLLQAIDGSPAPRYKNPKSNEIRDRALRVHFAPLHSRDVDKITTLDVASILRKLAAQTAIKAHTAIRRVFDYAITTLEPHDVRMVNPADPRRLRAVGWSAKPPSESELHAAVHWRVMPSVVDELTQTDAVDEACMLFIIATGMRVKTVRLAKWKNIDFEERAWTPPFPDLKERHHKRSFIIPLNDVALGVLERMRGRSPRFVFANSAGGPIGDNAITNLIRRLRRRHDDWRDPDTDEPFTAHGFRSALRTFTQEMRPADWALGELSLGHKVHGDVAGRYIRTGLVEERRALLDAWSRHLRSEDAKVVTIGRGRVQSL